MAQIYAPPSSKPWIRYPKVYVASALIRSVPLKGAVTRRRTCRQQRSKTPKSPKPISEESKAGLQDDQISCLAIVHRFGPAHYCSNATAPTITVIIPTPRSPTIPTTI